jgi:hypothetical protein
MTGIENVFRESIPLDLFSMGPISIPWAHSAIGIKLFDLKKKVNNIFPPAHSQERRRSPLASSSSPL